MKTNAEDFACLGGVPAFAEPLHVGRPNLGDRDRFRALVDGALDRRWLTNDGPLLIEFEHAVAMRLGVRHCVATSSGSAALELAIRATGLRGEAIVPSFTFVATAHALSWQGITPVFCDINPDTYTMDPASVESLIGPETSGIIGVHLWGRSCDVGALEELAERHGLSLLFDGAQAFGSTYGGIPLGRFGEAEILSFHATKVINSLEGGAVVTDDDELAGEIRLLRSHGFSGPDEVVAVGTNAKMNELSAAMGIASLDSFDSIVADNAENFDAYERGLLEIPGVRLISKAEGESNSFHYVVVEIDEQSAGVSRDQIQQMLHAENVLARRYFYPGCHKTMAYRTLPLRAPLPVTERASDRVLCLPTGQTVDTAMVQDVCAVLGLAVEHADVLRKHLPEKREQ